MTTWHILQDQQQKVATSGTFFDQRFSLVDGVEHVINASTSAQNAHQKQQKNIPMNSQPSHDDLWLKFAATRISSPLIRVIMIPIKAWYFLHFGLCLSSLRPLKKKTRRKQQLLVILLILYGLRGCFLVIQAIATDDVEKFLNTTSWQNLEGVPGPSPSRVTRSDICLLFDNRTTYVCMHKNA